MDVVATLNEKLLNRPFAERQDESLLLEEYKHVAHRYSKLENAIAVLSDLKSDKSFIYFGGLAEKLGIAQKDSTKEISSIWEEDIFDKIYPDDLVKKHVLELQFFHFLKTVSIKERADYYVSSNMRMCDRSGKYVMIHHRMFYICNCPEDNLWLALCLYNYAYRELSAESPYGVIVNSSTGDIVKANKQGCGNMLSKREREILALIEKGKMSKEIANLLSISKNTVDRHRQNILEKLRVKNSFEACRVAKLMNLL